MDIQNYHEADSDVPTVFSLQLQPEDDTKMSK